MPSFSATVNNLEPLWKTPNKAKDLWFVINTLMTLSGCIILSWVDILFINQSFI